MLDEGPDCAGYNMVCGVLAKCSNSNTGTLATFCRETGNVQCWGPSTCISCPGAQVLSEAKSSL